MSSCEPATNSEEDTLATERAHAMDQLVVPGTRANGRYPEALAFLPETCHGDQVRRSGKDEGALDFIGVNLYYRAIVSAPSALERLSHAQQWLFPAKMVGGEQGPKTDFGWEIWPQALYDMVTHITRDFNRPVIEITESGCAYNDGPTRMVRFATPRRIRLSLAISASLAQAIADVPTFAAIMRGV